MEIVSGLIILFSLVVELAKTMNFFYCNGTNPNVFSILLTVAWTSFTGRRKVRQTMPINNTSLVSSGVHKVNSREKFMPRELHKRKQNIYYKYVLKYIEV
jgi:hypothetical protein